MELGQPQILRKAGRRIVSLSTSLLPSKIEHKRQIYGMLDFFGDIGGFVEAIYWFGFAMVVVAQTRFYNNYLARSLYYIQAPLAS